MSQTDEIIERFPALQALRVCQSAFVRRVPGVDVTSDKSQALIRLEGAHYSARRALDMADWPLLTAEQVHGNRVAVIDSAILGDQHLAGYDGFITNQPRTALGVYVADCSAVYHRAGSLREEGNGGSDCAEGDRNYAPTFRIRSRRSGRSAKPVHSATALRSRFCGADSQAVSADRCEPGLRLRCLHGMRSPIVLLISRGKG